MSLYARLPIFATFKRTTCSSRVHQSSAMYFGSSRVLLRRSKIGQNHALIYSIGRIAPRGRNSYTRHVCEGG